jgi:hypothetical protein
MRVWKEEVFGPVLPVVSYKTDGEAITLANDTIYGLSGYIYTASRARTEKLAALMPARSHTTEPSIRGLTIPSVATKCRVSGRPAANTASVMRAGSKRYAYANDPGATFFNSCSAVIPMLARCLRSLTAGGFLTTRCFGQ